MKNECINLTQLIDNRCINYSIRKAIKKRPLRHCVRLEDADLVGNVQLKCELLRLNISTK